MVHTQSNYLSCNQLGEKQELTIHYITKEKEKRKKKDEKVPSGNYLITIYMVKLL